MCRDAARVFIHRVCLFVAYWALLRFVRTVVKAVSITPNAKQTLFAVIDLVTPLGLYPYAVLREREIIQIEAQVSAVTLKSHINP